MSATLPGESDVHAKAHSSWLYSRFSHLYDAVFEPFFAPRLEYAIRRMKIGPGEHILDLGVGTGLSLPFYPPHCRVTAVDISADMLEVCRERIREHGLTNVELVQMDATRLELSDATFDRALAGFFISVVSDPQGVMRQIRRVVKPGGQVVLVNHFRSDNPVMAQLEDLLCPLCRRLGWYTDLRFRDVFANGDFKIVSRTRISHLDLWDVVFAVNRPGGRDRGKATP